MPNAQSNFHGAVIALIVIIVLLFVIRALQAYFRLARSNAAKARAKAKARRLLINHVRRGHIGNSVRQFDHDSAVQALTTIMRDHGLAASDLSLGDDVVTEEELTRICEPLARAVPTVPETADRTIDLEQLSDSVRPGDRPAVTCLADAVMQVSRPPRRP